MSVLVRDRGVQGILACAVKTGAVAFDKPLRPNTFLSRATVNIFNETKGGTRESRGTPNSRGGRKSHISENSGPKSLAKARL